MSMGATLTLDLVAIAPSVGNGKKLDLTRLDLGFDPLQGGPHPVAIGLAASPAQHGPVQAERQGLGQGEGFGDVGTVSTGLQLIAPDVQGFLGPAYPEGEL